MNNERVYNEKADFVSDELTAMLRTATRGWISHLDYRREGYNEAVTVHTPTAVFDVNVTADSLWAISRDVMRAVSERFD